MNENKQNNLNLRQIIPITLDYEPRINQFPIPGAGGWDFAEHPDRFMSKY